MLVISVITESKDVIWFHNETVKEKINKVEKGVVRNIDIYNDSRLLFIDVDKSDGLLWKGSHVWKIIPAINKAGHHITAYVFLVNENKFQ